MDRRRFLALGATGLGVVAGCAGRAETDTESGSGGTATSSQTSRPTERSGETDSPTDSPTDTPRENPDTVFVDAEAGEAGAPGTADRPLDSIQRALERAEPGETVYARPGVYRELVRPSHGGEPGAPITLTGPPDAVLESHPDVYNVVLIRHSHVHVTGLTIDGLENPDAPDDVDSYSDAQLVQARPPTSTDEYLEDVVVAPHRIGNSQKSLVSLERTRNAEVGPFRVVGPAGTKYLLTDRAGHNGEIVYVGTSPSNLGTEWHPWTEYDQTSGIRVHHIDNSGGHGHSELVNTKLGTHDVTVEYCTDGGGSRNTEDSPAAAVRLQSFGATVRWCHLADGHGHGVEIASYKARDAQERTDDPSEIERRGGTDNAVYGNRIRGFDGKALAFEVDSQTQADQRHVCGNEYDGPTDGDPDADCDGAVPAGDGVGHTGGDSPWA
jgi:hypothetical protein